MQRERLHCRRAVAASFTVLAASAPAPCAAIDYNLLVSPPAQGDSEICQSYSLAIALSLANNGTKYPIRNFDDLSELSSRLRFLVKKEKGDRTLSDRDDWKAAIEKATGGEYTLACEMFSSYEPFAQFLASKVARTLDSNPIKFTETTVSSPSRIYLASFNRINDSTYKAGHVVSILGQERVPGQENSTVPIPSPLALLVINSADKVGICSDMEPHYRTRYVGYTWWTKSYDLKYLRLDYVIGRDEAQQHPWKPRCAIR